LRASVEAFFLRVCDFGTSEGERRAKSRGDVLEPVDVLKPGWAGDDHGAVGALVWSDRGPSTDEASRRIMINEDFRMVIERTRQHCERTV
jgi:hypothetical protein